MASYSTTDFETALLKKGFVRYEGDHHMFRLHVDGKKTLIKTKTSHSEKSYDDNLLKQRRQQIGLQSKQQFLDFVECPLDEEMYREILIKSGRVKVIEQAE